MNPIPEYILNQKRRHFLGGSAGLGAMALSSLEAKIQSNLSHIAPKAKRVIYLFQEGGPSHVDTFDYKPKLQDYAGQDLRKFPNIYQNQRLTGMTSGQKNLPLRPSPFKFKHCENNEDGVFVSEHLPYTSQLSKDISFIHSMHTESINHAPAVTMMQTGHELAGRPSMGAWCSYGLGSMNRNLPSFVVMISHGKGMMQALFSRFWGSAFLPSEHQGVGLRNSKDAVLYLNNPKGMSRSQRRRMLDFVAKINHKDAMLKGDSEILARTAQYEMAYRMQTAVPDLTKINNESKKTLEMYGSDVHQPGTYAANCLLARRLAERDVKFIQLYHRGWDTHVKLTTQIPDQCRDTDQAQAALIKDLKQRGLLDSTLVVWGGEFGRTSFAQIRGKKGLIWGRDHHPRCFTIWMAGGGVKPGIRYGRSDDFGYNIADKKKTVHVHDFQATLMHLLGIEHTKLTYRFQGRDYRLTDVGGRVIEDILS